MIEKEKHIEAIEQEVQRIISLHPTCQNSTTAFRCMPEPIVEYGVELNDLWEELTGYERTTKVSYEIVE